MRRKILKNVQIFSSILPRPNTTIDIFVILNILIVIGLSLLFSSRLFLPAGIGIELPQSGYVQRSQVGHVITVKNSVQGNNLLILDDGISSINALKRDLLTKDSLQKNRNHDLPILLRIDRATPLDTIIRMCNIVKEAGYTTVELALNGME